MVVKNLANIKGYILNTGKQMGVDYEIEWLEE